ncbi:MAG TPA: site-specific DNA-methyltransferase [Nitrososphaeraceae archaeon]|jgi:site-specific DNA-methyltransferase (adenine-specific)|nr:site-specific DNA-methyltransferase [Nitrososphaeraceae archaeon]
MLVQQNIVNEIITGNCKEILSRIPANSIQLTITSPPYRNAIDYNMHVSGNGGYYRGRTKLETSEYLEDMVEIFNDKVYRVTNNGGYCCIVIANEVINGTLLPLPHMLLSRLIQPFGNWNLHEEIIWHKVTGGTNRYGSFVINPYPKYYRANIMHEFILVLRKGDVNSGRTQRIEMLPATHEEWTKEIANSIWHIAPVPPGYIEHPCPFPEEIPYRLMKLYSYEDDVILDPFNGSGQTTKVAFHFHRRYLGIDTVKQYTKLAKGRLNDEPLHIRPEALIANWKKIPSHHIRRIH